MDLNVPITLVIHGLLDAPSIWETHELLNVPHYMGNPWTVNVPIIQETH